MVASRMKDIFVKGPDVERNCDRIEIERSRVRVDKALGYYRDQIGLRDYMQSLQVVRNS